MTADNFQAYVIQVTLIVLGCAGLPRLLKLRSPGVQYAFWRTLLVVCLLLPIVQPWQTHEMVFMPAPVGARPLLPAAPPTGGAPAPSAAAFDWVAAAQFVILLGISARVGWIAIGMTRLRRMRKRADGVADGFEDLQTAISARAPILWSSEVRHPVTFGVLKPVVLLPTALKTADLAAQRAVVAHELHHVKRRDWGWVVVEEMIRSVFWFHPAMWWLVSRVQLSRETVVDELSILATNARRTYLDTLLAFADDTGLASSPAFSARRHLFHRIMLLSKEGEMSSIRVAVGSCVLVLALGASAWGAIEAFPLYGDWSEPPPVSEAGAGQQPRDARVASRIDIDFEDADLRSVLRMLAKETRLNLVFDPEVPDGRVNVLMHDVPWDEALERILRTQKLGYTVEGSTLRIAPLASLGGRQSQQHRDKLREAAGGHVMVFSPKARSADRAQAIEIRPDDAPQSPPPAPEREQQVGGSVMVFSPAPGGGAGYDALIEQYKPVRIGGGLKTPMKIRDVKPVYPPIAQSARVQGVVILEVLIDTAGYVADARILRSIPLLDQAAYDSVKQWEFTPSLLNGLPTPVVMTVTVNFVLQ
jgi:TonB family protein